MTEKLKLLIIGAHPDDADYAAGGLAVLYRQLGHEVKMVSVTDGGAGHHQISGPELVARRRREANAAAEVIGATYEVWDNPDGALQPTLENRWKIIRLIRTFKPDLVLTHRPNDYHPDHRYTSLLVQDAAYLVTVPPVVPEVPHLEKDPVIAYMPDSFQKPYPFQPTVSVDVSSVLPTIVDMLACHVSQFYEWLPYNGKFMKDIPSDESGKKAYLSDVIKAKLRGQANRFRDALIRDYSNGEKIEFAEAYEACEYGSLLNEEAKKRLFPFVQQ